MTIARPGTTRAKALLCGGLLLAVSIVAGAQSRPTSDLRELLLTAGNPVLAAADASYARRSEGRIGAKASPRAISEAISGYETASQARESAEARWKLARALFFRAKYTGLDR
ncbi:MAG: hypothetical protein ACRD3M_09665, partial [Thermoanaerobaculia bacterium]